MKKIKTKTFLYVILIISFGIFYALYLLTTPKPSDLIGFAKLIPKVISIDLVIFLIFQKWLWKLSIFKNWLVPFQNLNGTWKGFIHTNWINPETGKKPEPIPVILTIHQSFSKISCVMRTKEMVSHSYISDFIIEKESQINRLSYSYISNPNQTVRERSVVHNGTMLFDIIDSGVKKLSGQYWTERQTTGQVKLEFWKKKKLQDYPDELGKHPVSKS